MARFIDCMRALGKLTNWKALSESDNAGRYHVELEGDLALDFEEQGNEAIILKAVAYEMPFDKDGQDRLIQACGRLMMAIRRQRKSQLTLETTPEDVIQCLIFRKLNSYVAVDQFLREVEDWINDVVWWKRNIQSALSAEQGKGDSISSLLSTAFPGKYY